MNKETQNRRQFFKEVTKKALPFIGAIVLVSSPIIVKAVEKENVNCNNACSYSCTSCVGDCYGTCKNGCQGSCKNGCLGSCKGTCEASCRNSCHRSNV